jgi:hypothetical protein
MRVSYTTRLPAMPEDPYSLRVCVKHVLSVLPDHKDAQRTRSSTSMTTMPARLKSATFPNMLDVYLAGGALSVFVSGQFEGELVPVDMILHSMLGTEFCRFVRDVSSLDTILPKFRGLTTVSYFYAYLVRIHHRSASSGAAPLQSARIRIVSFVRSRVHVHSTATGSQLCRMFYPPSLLDSK